MFQLKLKEEYKQLQPYCDLIYDILFDVGNVFVGKENKMNHYGQLYNNIVDQLNKYTEYKLIHFDGVK